MSKGSWIKRGMRARTRSTPTAVYGPAKTPKGTYTTTCPPRKLKAEQQWSRYVYKKGGRLPRGMQ